MSSMWDAQAAQSIRGRITRLDPERRGEWGRMTAPLMVRHLSNTLKMALGDLRVPPLNLPVRFWPLKQFVIFWAPFPRNAPTAPEVLAGSPGEWTAEVAELQRLIDSVCARAADANAGWPSHPAFGRMSRRAWGVHVYRHMDHHLRQFGV